MVDVNMRTVNSDLLRSCVWINYQVDIEASLAAHLSARWVVPTCNSCFCGVRVFDWKTYEENIGDNERFSGLELLDRIASFCVFRCFLF